MTANGKRREIDMGINPDDESVKIADAMKQDASVVRAVFETEEQRITKRAAEKEISVNETIILLAERLPEYEVRLFTGENKPADALKDVVVTQKDSKNAQACFVHVAEDLDAVGEFIHKVITFYSIRMRDPTADNKAAYLQQIISKIKQRHLYIILAKDVNEIADSFEEQKSQFEILDLFQSRALEEYIKYFLRLK